MKLSRLGSFHQSKLSFLRSFLKEFKDWNYKRDLFELNEHGYGTAVYSFKKKNRVYSLICFANELDDNERSDRVIATKWDAAFTLFDGVPKKQDIERLKNEVPKQEFGRLSYKELTLSRANKSVRVFNHVVKCFVVFHFRSNFYPVRVVAVLKSIFCILSSGLNVPSWIWTNPNINPSWRKGHRIPSDYDVFFRDRLSI